MLDTTATTSPGRESSIQKETSVTGELVMSEPVQRESSPADHDSVRPRGVNGAANQEAALTNEGVDVVRGSLGERSVDFLEFGWFPARLPSEEADDEEDD